MIEKVSPDTLELRWISETPNKSLANRIIQ